MKGNHLITVCSCQRCRPGVTRNGTLRHHLIRTGSGLLRHHNGAAQIDGRSARAVAWALQRLQALASLSEAQALAGYCGRHSRPLKTVVIVPARNEQAPARQPPRGRHHGGRHPRHHLRDILRGFLRRQPGRGTPDRTSHRRLNGGDRQANAPLYRIALTPSAGTRQPATTSPAHRRRETRCEAIRCSNSAPNIWP